MTLALKIAAVSDTVSFYAALALFVAVVVLRLYLGYRKRKKAAS